MATVLIVYRDRNQHTLKVLPGTYWNDPKCKVCGLRLHIVAHEDAETHEQVEAF